MYSESFTVSEFALRLSKTQLSSFDDIVALLNDYESFCELRANEIDYLVCDSSKNNSMEEYEFVKGEEYLWALMKELVTLFVAESKLTNPSHLTPKGEEPLNSNFQFLYWSAIQNWLQKMKRKTTTISTYEATNRSTDMSFNSLFQKSTEETSFQEAELLKTMFDTFRCGAFDDPSNSAEDWNRIFDGYSNIWRQCSLNGASANESIRDIFRRFCRTFQSDNLYECILYCIHTAESVSDLQQIEHYFDSLYNESLESYCMIDKVMDILWSCVTCLLYQLSLQSQHQQHGNIRELENYTRGKINDFIRMKSLSCQYIGYLLNDSLDSVLMEDWSQVHPIDMSRLNCHFLLILHQLSSLIATTSFSMDITTIQYTYPFASLRGPVNYHTRLLAYIHLLEQDLDIHSICGYEHYLNDEEKMTLFSEFIQLLFNKLCQEPYSSFLQDCISDKTCQNYIMQKVSILVQTIENQSQIFQQEFYSRNLYSLIHREQSSSTDYIYTCRYLCYILHYMNAMEWKGSILYSLHCILDACASTHPESIVAVLNSIGSEMSLQEVHTESWCVLRIQTMNNNAIIKQIAFYQELYHYCQRMDSILSCNDRTEQELVLSTLFDEMVSLFLKSTKLNPGFVSALLIEWLSTIERCRKTLPEKEQIPLHQLVLSKITSITLPTCPLRSSIQTSLASTLLHYIKESMVGVLYKPC